MKRKLAAPLGIVGVMALWGQVAKADFILTLDDAANGGVEVIVADNVGAGVFLPDSGLTTTHADVQNDVGVVGFDGPIGAFLANNVVGVSKPFAPPDRLILSGLHASNGSGVMTASLTNTDFSANLPFDVVNGVGGTTDGTVVSEWGTDLDNGHFSFASGFGSIGPFGPGAFDGAGSIDSVDGDPSLSLTNSIIVTHTGGGNLLTSYGSNVTIPEPGAALLLIAVVPIVLRRR